MKNSNVTRYQDLSKNLELVYKYGLLVNTIWDLNCPTRMRSKLQLEIQDKEEDLDLVIFKKMASKPHTNSQLYTASEVSRIELRYKIFVGFVLVITTVMILIYLHLLVTQNQ